MSSTEFVPNATVAASHLIDPTYNRVQIISEPYSGVGGRQDYIAVRFEDGMENSFPVEAVTPDKPTQELPEWERELLLGDAPAKPAPREYFHIVAEGYRPDHLLVLDESTVETVNRDRLIKCQGWCQTPAGTRAAGSCLPKAEVLELVREYDRHVARAAYWAKQPNGLLAALKCRHMLANVATELLSEYDVDVDEPISEWVF
jgi:hypothetical protein